MRLFKIIIYVMLFQASLILSQSTEELKILKEKYNQKKVEINFNFKDIIRKRNYNLVIISSVIQYISIIKFKKLIEIISKSKKKRKEKLFIIITDIPIFPRPFEFVLMPFFNKISKALNNVL